MSFPVEYSIKPSNTVTSLPQGMSQSGDDGSCYDDTLEGFSIRTRRTLMQRTRDSHPHFLNGESVLQNVPGGNPQASLWVGWEHINTMVPGAGNPQAWDRYAYSSGNPVKYTDPTGYFSEDQIKVIFGFEKDDLWEEVVKLFQKGGKYEGRWGWLEILRRAEVGDQITVDWIDNLPGNRKTLPKKFTFDLDKNGNLILIGNGIYINAGLAGLYGENYTLSHYTDLSDLCSPGKCGYTSIFTTSSIHDPYLHTKVKWDEFRDIGADWELLEFLSVTTVSGAMTGVMGASIVVACTTPTSPASCPASITFLGPAFYGGIWSTWMIGTGAYKYFMNEYIENTP